MPRNNRFVVGDKVIVGWANGTETEAIVMCSPGNNDDGCWYLHNLDGKLFALSPASSGLEAIWEWKEEAKDET